MTTEAVQKVKSMKAAVDYEEMLLRELTNHEFAAEYLSAAFQEPEPEVFLLALRHVVQANGGVSNLVEKAHISRQNVYDILSENSNPRFNNFVAIVRSLGFNISFHPN